MTPPLSSAEAEALLRASPLAPRPEPWRLQAVPNHRLDPGARQQFHVISGIPCGFLTLGPDLAEYIARARLLAGAYPGLATAVIGQARQGGRDLLLQEHIAGRPLLEANDPAQVMLVLAQLESQLAAALEPSTPEAAAAELHQLGDQVLSLSLWTKRDRDFLRSQALPFLRSRLISPAPKKRISNCDFLSRNLLVGAGGGVRLIDCDHAAVTHFYGEDWLRFGYWDDLAPAVRAWVDLRAGDRAAWCAYLALRQLVLEARLHRDRRFRIDAQRWCGAIQAALATDPALAAQIKARPGFGPRADQRIGVQLFWSDANGWSEAAAELIEVGPGTHRLIFSPPPHARQFRIDPLDLPGTALIKSLVVADAKSNREYLVAAGAALDCLTPAGDARVAAPADEAGLRINSQGNDPQLYLPPLDLPSGAQIRFEISLSVSRSPAGFSFGTA